MDTFKARLKIFSDQWHEYLGCEERVYLPTASLPLSAFDPEQRHYKTLHGTDIFILRDDEFEAHEIPFHPRDYAFIFVISADPAIEDEDEWNREREPQWLSTYYYLRPSWICLDFGYWLRGWWNLERYNTPSCHGNDSQGSLELDLELRAPAFRKAAISPFSPNTHARTSGPVRVPGTRACCSGE